jgi:hypothetical protein
MAAEMDATMGELPGLGGVTICRAARRDALRRRDGVERPARPVAPLAGARV